MKPLILSLILGCALCVHAQKTKPVEPRPGMFCTAESATYVNDEGLQIPLMCSKGKWVVDKKALAANEALAEKKAEEWLAARCKQPENVAADALAQQKIDLELAMRTRVVSDADFLKVVKFGTGIFAQDKCADQATYYQWDTTRLLPSYDPDKESRSLQARLDELFAQQFRLRTIQACGGKKECAQ